MGTWVGGTSSLPMEMTATRGRRGVGTSVTPQPAKKPTPAALMTSPARTTASPARASSPASRTLPRSLAGASKATRLPGRPSPSTLRTISYFTTASAAVGSGAPVMMRTHAPSGISPSKVSPAATSAITSSSTGDSGLADCNWAARMANPSMAAWANGEMSISLFRSTAATRPAASNTGTVSAGSWETCDNTRSRACSTEIISGMACPFDCE